MKTGEVKNEEDDHIGNQTKIAFLEANVEHGEDIEGVDEFVKQKPVSFEKAGRDIIAG